MGVVKGVVIGDETGIDKGVVSGVIMDDEVRVVTCVDIGAVKNGVLALVWAVAAGLMIVIQHRGSNANG